MSYKIEINNLTSNIGYDLFDEMEISIKSFSHTFEEGKCYGLDMDEHQGYLVSMALCGVIKGDGVKVYKDGKQVGEEELLKDSLLMGLSREKKTFREEINSLNLSKEAVNNLFEKYGLSENRIKRSYENTSSERWRMSFALGSLLDKKLYCFPYIPIQLAESYAPLWLKDFIDEVKDRGGIVVVPNIVTPNNKYLFDEVIN